MGILCQALRPSPHSCEWLVLEVQGAGGGGTSADAILDVITARMGLSQYFARLDALTSSPQFCAAAAGPRLLTPVTRDEADAAMAADEGTPQP